jgi:hypothetical protein
LYRMRQRERRAPPARQPSSLAPARRQLLSARHWPSLRVDLEKTKITKITIFIKKTKHTTT